MKIQFSAKVSLAVFALFLLLGTYPSSAQTPIQNEVVEPLASDGVPGPLFGFSAAIDGGTSAETLQLRVGL